MSMKSFAGFSKMNGAEKEKIPKIYPNLRCDVLSTYLFAMHVMMLCQLMM